MPTMTDQGGGTLRIAASTVLLRAANTTSDNIVQYEVAQQDVDIPADVNRYVGCQYNSGNPNYVVKASDTWNNNNEFRVGAIANEGDTLHILERRQRRGNFPHWVTEYLRDVYGLRRADAIGGLILSESGDTNRYVEMSTGELFDTLLEHDIDAFDSSGTDRFDVYYRKVSDSGWNKVANQRVWPNTQYDDNSGSLATLGSNKYAVLWFYLETDSDIVMLYGQGQYPTQAAAVAEAPPSGVPGRLELHGTLLGNIIFRKSATTAAALHTAFTVQFGSASIVDHGSLGGLGHDDHPGYPYLDGRSGGQILYGGVDAGDSLRFASTSHATGGSIYFGNDKTTGVSLVCDTLVSSVGATVGTLNFIGDDAGAASTEYVVLTAYVLDATAGAEKGRYRIRVTDGGSLSNIARFDTDSIGLGASDALVVKNGASVNTLIVESNGRVGIGAGPSTSSALGIASTIGALTIPRMTTGQRNALTTINGMRIYNTTTERNEYIENGSWVYHASTPA